MNPVIYMNVIYIESQNTQNPALQERKVLKITGMQILPPEVQEWPHILCSTPI